MSSLRDTLSSLPFAAEFSDGTINLWAVNGSGSYRCDVDRGRSHAAILLHLMREQDAPHMLAHVLDAWAAAGPGTRDVKTGFCLELGDAVLAADEGCPLLVLVSNTDFRLGSYRENILRLPFVSERPDGSLSLFEPVVRGDYSENVDRGRHHGALVCKFLRDTGNGGLFGHMNEASPWAKEQSAGEEAYRVGLCSAIAHIACSCSPRSTLHQVAMREFYLEIAPGKSARAYPVA